MPLDGPTPMLNVRDLDETIAFYRDILGFEVQGTWGHDPSKPTWCSLRKECAQIMATSFWGGHDAEEPKLTGSLYFYPDDVDALAKELDGKVALEWGPETFAYGMREIAVRDNNGYLLIFGQEAEAEGNGS